MSGDTFAGLRPIAKRQLDGDLERKTKRIVLPSPTGDGLLPQPVVEPPWVIPVQKHIVKKNFSLMPVTPSLLELLPKGIIVTPEWIFIGSNPSVEHAVYTALILRMDGISKTHAAVKEFNEKPFITDMGSTNGTRIFRSEEAIEVTAEPVELQSSDILRIGSVFFDVVQG